MLGCVFDAMGGCERVVRAGNNLFSACIVFFEGFLMASFFLGLVCAVFEPVCLESLWRVVESKSDKCLSILPSGHTGMRLLSVSYLIISVYFTI